MRDVSTMMQSRDGKLKAFVHLCWIKCQDVRQTTRQQAVVSLSFSVSHNNETNRSQLLNIITLLYGGNASSALMRNIINRVKAVRLYPECISKCI